MCVSSAKYHVIQDWAVSYADPIHVCAGEALVFSGKADVWDGHTWLWVKCASGREGWAPDDLIQPEPPYTARYDYNALELGCKTGQVLTGQQVKHGWVFCLAEGGQSGWVPERNLRKVSS